MKFWRKLLYYLLGVGLGLIMVYFFFGDREIGCSYFPNDRVLSDLRKKKLVIGESVDLWNGAGDTDSAVIDQILLSGDVDFEKSVTRDADSCNIYWIDYQDEVRGSFSSTWVNCDSIVYLVELKAKQ
jgi:hypothetical protein